MLIFPSCWRRSPRALRPALTNNFAIRSIRSSLPSGVMSLATLVSQFRDIIARHERSVKYGFLQGRTADYSILIEKLKMKLVRLMVGGGRLLATSCLVLAYR